MRQYEATGSEDALEAQDLIEPITQVIWLCSVYTLT